ncbi:MAG: hypothetical protein ACW987_20020 [Candidatus Thorarchaeota archaeon]|jgi:hypothetical protein
MTIKQIKAAIQKLDRNEVIEIRQFVTRISSSTSGLRVGMKAKFFHSKTGATIEGTITKVNRKTIKIDSRQDKWGKDTGFNCPWVVGTSLVEIA